MNTRETSLECFHGYINCIDYLGLKLYTDFTLYKFKQKLFRSNLKPVFNVTQIYHFVN